MSFLTINEIDKEMELILHTYEQHNQFKEALQGYLGIEEKILHQIDIGISEVAESSVYKILAQCYLRIGNMYRALGNLFEADLYN